MPPPPSTSSLSSSWLPSNLRVNPSLSYLLLSTSLPLSAPYPSSPAPVGPLTSPDPSLAPILPPTAPFRTHLITTRSRLNIHKPKIPANGTVRYPPPRALTASLSSPDHEPTCFFEAAKSEPWRAAMANECHAFIQNGTWTLVSSHHSMNIIGCKWVFRIKHKADGTIDRYKARLVAKGFHQQPGLDFQEIYSPVIKPITIRAVLSFDISYGWPIKQIDISNAFLHGFLSETVHMAQPPGFVHPQHPNVVCLLKMAIYCLKQAPRAWFSRLRSKLLECGFAASLANSSLFLLKFDKVHLLVLVYVDDILLICSSLHAVNHLIKLLSADFPIKDLGDLTYSGC